MLPPVKTFVRYTCIIYPEQMFVNKKRTNILEYMFAFLNPVC